MMPQANFFKTLGNGGNGKKVGIDYLCPNFFSRFEKLEKLLSNEHSFIIFVMKLCAERKTI